MHRRWIVNAHSRASFRVQQDIRRTFPDDAICIVWSEREMRDCLSAAGADVVNIIVGGDGTWSKALAMDAAGVLVGYCPAGTLNQSALELNQTSMVKVWRDWREEAIYVGRAMTHNASLSFFMMLGAGIEADAVYSVRPWLKRIAGRGAYIVALIERLLRPVRKSLTVYAGGRVWCTSQVLLLNGRFYGGDYQITDKTDVFRPGCVLLVWKAGGRVNWLCGMLASMFHFRLRRLWVDEVVLNEGEVRIVGAGHVQVDGDPAGRVPVVTEQPGCRRVVIAEA